MSDRETIYTNHYENRVPEPDNDSESENIVYVGNKPVMNYVLAVVTQMNGGTKEVLLKARGRAISRAVDVAEIVKNRFITDMTVENISICTEEVISNEGHSTNVSAIEIQLVK